MEGECAAQGDPRRHEEGNGSTSDANELHIGQATLNGRRAHRPFCARTLASGGARFEPVDFEESVPPDRYDVIVFNESIYYSARPEEVLRRYMGALTPDGVMIVSMCENRRQRSIWRALESVARIVHSTAVTNEQNLTWHVRVLRTSHKQ